jgi:uncharacterized membrane protein YdfJ with MMPL/SSD domain
MNTYETQYTMFNWATVAVYVLTALAMFGVSASAPAYLNYLRAGIQIYVGLFLLFRFHPFRTTGAKFSELDRKVAFTAGAFIAMTTILGATLNRYLEQTKDKAKDVIVSR